MSNRVSRGLASNRESRHRKLPLRLDLNAFPPDSQDQEATSAHAEHLGVQTAQPALIDVDAIVDDDVLISSPRAFAEAKSKATRNRSRTLVHFVDSGDGSQVCNNRNKRRRVQTNQENQTIINCGLSINLEGSRNSMGQGGVTSHVQPHPLPSPLSNPPAFSCPICMGPLVEEMSTKCGHIFCKGCIKAATSAQGKCPTCRKKISMKDTIRVYLPSTN